jgi:all-trans-8'-apo-beta-carotenal 15,15'-oxygenase
MQGGGFGFYHDMLVTENYYIVLENPLSLDFKKLIFGYSIGRACIAECLRFDVRKRTKVHLIPRPGRKGKLPPFNY